MSVVLPVAVSLIVFITLLRILRRGRLREKYAALWLFVGAGIVVLALWPDLLARLSTFFGFQVGSNFLYFLAILLLTGVGLHLSLEVSTLEDETRTLAEEVSMLWARIDALPEERASDEGPGDTGPAEPAP